jgi:hypothetical protein
VSEHDNLHPRDGARFLFELGQSDDERATYDAAIYTPDARFDYVAEVDNGGAHQVRATGEPAAADLEKKLLTMARLIARDASKRTSDGLPPWPRRVLRWRGPK